MGDGKAKLESSAIGCRALRFCAACLLIVATQSAGAARRANTGRPAPPRLTWSLFRPVESMPDSSEDAHIAAEMSFPQPLKIKAVDGRYRLPVFTITVAPELTRTMVRRSVGPSDSLLRHEQGHFDIVVLAARALARELESITASSARELTRVVEGCVAKHTARAERLSEQYDRQTDRSRESITQARWNGIIAAALKDTAVTHLAGLPL